MAEPAVVGLMDELSLEERDKLIDELARKIVGRRLETPAIMFLEMHKPVAFLASQSMIAVSPFLVPLFGPEGVRKYAQLFGTRENVELLIRRIEDLSEEKDAGTRRRGDTDKSGETGKK
jgi:hypothetical protein